MSCWRLTAESAEVVAEDAENFEILSASSAVKTDPFRQPT